MSTLNRRDLLSTLKTALESVSGVTSVVRSYADIDILIYKSTELPLINVVEPLEDNFGEETARHSMQFLDLKLKVWFVSWAEVPTSTYETLMKNIRDKLGAEFTLSQTATACWITSIEKLEGEMPVYNFEMSLRAKYHLDQQST